MSGKYNAKENGKFVFRFIGFFVSYCNAFLIHILKNCELMLWIDSLFVCKSISIVSRWFTLWVCMGFTVGDIQYN